MGPRAGGSGILNVNSDYTFGGSLLDRVAGQRGDSDWMEARWSDPDTRFLALCELRPLALASDPTRLAWLELVDLQDMDSDHDVVFLGLEGGAARFTVSVGEAEAARIEATGDRRFTATRALASTLTPGEAGTAAQARSLLSWHATHSYCATCGHPTDPVEAGWSRLCPACGTRHFPRTDPVVIMVIHRDDRCLLGRAVRSPRYPPGMYSCLAGYVEPAETIETAVRRETLEEVGIHVGEVRYHASQPWPFPSTLMIGCFAEALDTEIRLDPLELESARWFDRQELAAALIRWNRADATRMPPPFTIAHQLVRAWLAGREAE